MSRIEVPFRRGIDNFLANWPLLAFKVAETVLFVIVIIGGVFVAIVPPLVAAFTVDFSSADPLGILETLTPAQIGIVLYVAVVATLLAAVLLAIHSFFQAASIGTYADGERSAGMQPPSREAFRAFSFDRWLRWGRSRWLALFVIYNITWGLALLLLTLPLLGLLVVALLAGMGQEELAIGVACFGLFFFVVFMLLVIVATTIWTQLAITLSVARLASVFDAIGEALRLFFSRFWHLLLIMLVPFAISFAFGIVSLMLSGAFEVSREVDFFPLLFLPFRFGLSIIQSAVSLIVGLWLAAAYVSVVFDENRELFHA